MTTDIFFKIEVPFYQRKLESEYVIYAGSGTLLPADISRRIRIVVTSGFAGFTEVEMDKFPALGLICTIGTGYENVDLQAARERGIRVTHAAGANAVAVADHAFALLLSLVRRIPDYNTSTKANLWKGDIPPQPLISGKRLGIMGMGDIGNLIARRAAGFDMAISYLATAPKPALPYTFRPTALELAGSSDFLICAVPGGDATYHMVDRHVLAALGPRGYLVNVGRGSVVDTEALVDALERGGIAGAALDVFESEPELPANLRALGNVILTPHIGGVAPEVQEISADRMYRNIRAFLAGEPLVSPVPEMRTDV